MKKNIISIFILSALFGLSACDDGLDLIPTGTVSEAIFWESERDAELAVNAAYAELDNFGLVQLESVTDIAMHAPSGPQTLYDVAVGTIDPTNTAIRNYWRQYWRAVRKANDPIVNIDRIPVGRPEHLARLKAEARFLRAYAYTQLTSLWGDVPLVEEPLPVTAQVSRTDRNAVVDFIISELDAIAPLLPVSYSGSDIGRATRGAALALKARVALRNHRYAVARDAAQAVMNLGVYGIFPNYQQLFWYAGQNSSEVIFDRQYAVGYSTHNPFGRSSASLGGSSGIDPIHKYVTYHERIAPEDPNNPYTGLDPRFGYNTFYTGALLPNGTIYNSWPGSPTGDQLGASEAATQYGFNVAKWIDYDRDAANPGNSTINFIIIRYADVLLMYAEAKIELNEIDQSVFDAINQVRQRPTVNMPPVTSGSQAELREFIRRERAVEFAWEGLRLFDMNRWQIGAAKAGPVEGMRYIDPATGQWRLLYRGLDRTHRADRDYLWPIPQEETEVNPNIGQNPNY
jgi:starch-binding outer membrane protein, SusD/RagB family